MYIGIDIGASKTLLALFDKNGGLLKQKSFATPADIDDFLKQLTSAYKTIQRRTRIKGIGMAIPGSVDKEAKVILACGNLPWRNSDLPAQFERRVKVPTQIENDAVLGGLAEANLGAAQGETVVLYITIGTGVGTGIIINGRIHPALDKSEGGMMVVASRDQSYKRLEDLVAGPDFRERFGKYGFDVIDPNIWEAFARDLAAGVFNMITLVQPTMVVLGGGMSVHFEAFKRPLLKYLTQLNPGLYDLPPVKKAKFVETAVIYGAYLLAKSRPR